MAYIDFLSAIHRRTTRDYIGRVTDPEYPKAKAAELAKRWDLEYWDGDRRTGYGGMKYDGRWRKVAEDLAAYYGLRSGDRVLDIGCGKGFLMYDLTQVVPGVEVVGLEISEYAKNHAKFEVKEQILLGHAAKLPFEDSTFDLVLGINTHHNLKNFELDAALKEMMRVGRRHRYLCVESFRNESEKANLLYWQLTCHTFASPEEWEWWFSITGYTGDYSFIFFE